MGQKRQLDEVCEGADPLRSWRCCGLDLLALGSSVFILRGRLEPSSGPLHIGGERTSQGMSAVITF
jgi:hypothetical protein